MHTSFEWDDDKNRVNKDKHGVNFETAQYAFLDSRRIIARDFAHSVHEKRYFCFGKVRGGILTVRFTHRQDRIRIIGAGFWQKGKKIYEKQNQI